MFSPYFSSKNSSFKFILDILDGMHDWVRVVDKNHSVIFINRSMEEALCVDDLSGKKCFELLGRETPCDNCITLKAVFEGKTFKKEEVFSNRTFSTMSSPIIADDGQIHYAVEVLRDVTKEKELENRLLNQNLKLQQDLDMARNLQMQLLPRNIKLPHLDFAYFYRPCTDLSGDMVNILPIDEEHTGIYIADVSGHGVSASMLTIFLTSALKRKTHSPGRALYRLFKQFNDSEFDKNSYITVFYAIYNHRTHKLLYSNAGHNCIPLIYGKNGVQKLFMPGIPVSNWVDSPKYHDASTFLFPGDRLFLYTDGLADQWLENPEKITDETHIMNIIKDTALDLNVALNLIGRYVDKQLDTAHVKQKDDITMALIEPISNPIP